MHDEGTGTGCGPLDGIKVLDLSIAATGPYAATMMADQGAEVVKVERLGIGDIARYVGVQIDGISALFQLCNRGKRSIAVDLGVDAGRDVVRALAADCDVVIQNWRPGVAERLGVGYEDLRRDDLVYVSISGFGDLGPKADRAAYDTVIQAQAGMAHAQADPATGEPTFVRQVIADKVTALTAAQAVTAALLARERGHGGQHLRLSMLEAVVAFLWVDAAGNEVLRDGDGSQPGSFSAGAQPIAFEDGWGMVTPTSDADFFGMCRAFGVDGHDDPRLASPTLRQQNGALTREIVARCWAAAAAMTVAEASARLEAERVPYGILVSPADLAHDPQALALELLVDSDHPVAGAIRQPRHPTRFEATPARVGGPSPSLGQHTDELLAEAGLADRIADLRAAGVVG
jgi:crotonobetainyl-CoA:carnitine CoA-transferase CaiB-like acyl-CoA transferase